MHHFPAHPQRDVRERRLLRGHMQTERLPLFDILIRNISEHGLCASCRDLPPVPGEMAEIQLPDNRTVTATVRWVNEQVFGVAFDTPISLALMLQTLQRLRELAERNASWEVKSKHRVNTNHRNQGILRRV
ncbi:PilZ domain-containing protein [Novosphingobium fuchskuhlense]|nr:PilZ domain-containing protein [Novosphingobium fuchskuhlense]